MERFDYIIVTSANKWESTGSQATQKEIDQDVVDVMERLQEEGRDDEKITVFKANKMESTDV